MARAWSHPGDLRNPGHGSDRFHIALAHWMSRPDDGEWQAETDAIGAAIRQTLGPFALPAPDFRHFADMHAFVQRLSLATRHERAGE